MAIESLKLSSWGRIKLSCFASNAIAYADKQLRYAPISADPFKSFYALCLGYSVDNKLPIDYAKTEELAKKYTMPANPNFLTVVPAKKEIAPRKQIQENYGPRPQRTLDQIVEETNQFTDWQNSEAGANFRRLFGDDIKKPFWLHEMRD
jgi:hypothetical protein